ncbi:MAG: hypothetical protein J1G38_02280 [Clostridiales bacterium]|nr:hypothetical protein [Clostridiales bacterium]
MIFEFPIDTEPLDGIVEENIYVFGEYFSCKSILKYFLYLILFLISFSFAVPFVAVYGIFRGSFYFQDDEATSLFEIVLDIKNKVLKVFAGIFLFPIYFVFYVISLIVSMPLYIFSWILGILSFGVATLLHKCLNLNLHNKGKQSSTLTEQKNKKSMLT